MFDIPHYGQLQFILEQDTLEIDDTLIFRRKYNDIANIINANSGIDYQYSKKEIAIACNYLFVY